MTTIKNKKKKKQQQQQQHIRSCTMHQVSLEEKLTNLESILNSRDINLPTKIHLVKAMVLPVVMFGCESWTIKKAEHWRTYAFNCGVGEKTLESPLDSKEIKPVNPKGNQLCIFIGRTDAEAKVPILWPNDAKDQRAGKDPDSGKDWRQGKGVTEDEVVGSRTQWTWVWANSRK